MWRIADQTIVHANEVALRMFGADATSINNTTLWDIISPIDQNLIVLESVRQDSGRESVIHIPEEAFASFKRLDNSETFIAWYRANDIVEVDGSTVYRAALIFSEFGSSENMHVQSFLNAKTVQKDRELASSVAHRLNNALAVLQSEIDVLSSSVDADIRGGLQQSLSLLTEIGLDMRRLAHVSDSIRAENDVDVLGRIFPNPNFVTDVSHTQKLLKVLVVDDEPSLISGLCAIMKVRKVDTESASSSDEAMLKAKMFKPDSALIDLALGSEDGFVLGQQLKTMYPRMNIVYMTGFHSRGPELIQKHKVTVIKKPFAIDDALSLLLRSET